MVLVDKEMLWYWQGDAVALARRCCGTGKEMLWYWLTRRCCGTGKEMLWYWQGDAVVLAWVEEHQEEWEHSFSEFTHGTWFPMAQQWVGPTCSVGGLIFYTNKVIVGKNCMVYPMYSE